MKQNKLDSKNKILIPYFTLGDPNLDFTEKLVKASLKAGATGIELGIPFSDPLADGPVIQSSHFRALTNNHDLNLNSAFNFLEKIRQEFSEPIYFMLSCNLVLQFGIEHFFKQAKKYNLSGVVIPDLILEESEEYYELSQKYQVPLIFFLSPLSKPERIKKIVKKAEGFIYLISSLGTTGERNNFAANLTAITKEIKKIKDIPVIVGFGIKNKEQFQNITKFANGGIIGSHFVKMIEDTLKNPEQAIKKITEEISNIIK